MTNTLDPKSVQGRWTNRKSVDPLSVLPDRWEDVFGNHGLVTPREEKLGFHLNVVDPETDLTTLETGPPVDTETRLT